MAERGYAGRQPSMQTNEQIANQSGRQADFRRSSLACRRIDNRQAVRQIKKQVEEEGVEAT
jgi:hypothetical protein